MNAVHRRGEDPPLSYTVLARRYRSRDFDEIVGQEPIARTLRNAIESDRIAHAYLFCGTRGVGKTSMARIFAKALNATADLNEREGIAEAIMRGADLDVIEIDGASNRGVNEARELIAGAGLSPARCPYKVYIIDEVHQLTKDAFNALLKLMEEPPSHVKFILCTTEPHKVPATIQSRCQRFDFRPLSTAKIADQLRRVLASEQLGADEDVVMELARQGNGSMRDALSVLDRMLATGENPLTMQTVQDTLGLPDRARVMELVAGIVAGDVAGVLKAGSAMLDTGATVEQVMQMLAEHFRDLLVARACSADTPLLEHPSETRERIAAQAESFDIASLVHMIAMCDHVARMSRDSMTSRALLDALLVRLAISDQLIDVHAVLESNGAEQSAPAARKKKARRACDDTVVAASGGSASDQAGARAGATSPMPAAARPSTPPPPKSPVESEPKPLVDISGEELWNRVVSADLDRGARRRVEQYEFASGDAECLRLRLSARGVQSPTLCQSPQYVDGVKREVEKVAGRRVRVVIEPPNNDDADASTPVAAASEQDIAAVREDPVVQRAVELFDGVIRSVQPRGLLNEEN